MCHKSISELSQELQETARKNERLLLNRLAELGQKEVGEKVGASESKMSKLKSEGHIEFFAILTAVMGIKLVDEKALYCSPAIAEATRQIFLNCSTSPDYLHILFGGEA